MGIWITCRLVDHFLRITVLASLAGFAFTSLMFGIAPSMPVIIYAGVALWGLTFGGAATLIQTALADAAGDGADVALSMNVVAWNGAIAGGGILGGFLLDAYGASSFPWALIMLLRTALAIAWSAGTHGFPRGGRLANAGASRD